MTLWREILSVTLLAVFTAPVVAQETIVVGDVTCAETGEPVPNANIYYSGTSVGTTSNEEGSFAIRSTFTKRRTLVVSAVGYHPQRFHVEPGIMAGIQVALNEKTAVLEEVYARPDDSYALALIAGVKAHREVNDRFLQPNTAEAEATTELFISDIESRHLRRRIWKSLQAGMISAEDSSLMLPLYVSRQRKILSGDEATDAGEREEHAVVLTSTDYTALLSGNGNINFYRNSVSLLGRSFLSPLASSSNTYYKYYLADSIDTETGKEYVLHFRTKNAYYATFNGEMRIDSATYALRAITAHVPAQTGINYLKSLHINQIIADDNSLQDEHISAILDFGVKTQQTKIFPTVLLRTSLSSGLSSRSPLALSGSPQSALSDSASSLSCTDSVLLTLDSLPLIRFAQWTASIINTGYIPTGTFLDVGNIQEILQVNEHEKVHLGLPFRTNVKLMKRVSLEASLGYGFRDRSFKGMGRINVQLPTHRRHVFFLEYQDHYMWTEVDDFTRLLHENGIGFRTMDFTAYAFEALRYTPSAKNTATRQRQLQLHFDNDWTDNIETQLYVRVGWMGYGDPLVGYRQIPYFPYQTIGGIVRVGFKERKIDGYFSRYHVYSSLPVLYVGLEAGSYQLPVTGEGGSSYSLFAKFNLLLRHRADLGMGGTLDYALQAGCIFGSVPYPFLHHFEGNQGYAYDPYRFTLMNNFQYAADKYVALHAEWNGQGILFNLIPGIRYLRLRELVTFKLAYGAITNAQPSAVSYSFSAFKAPYVELGCGIGNILRVLDIYSVWRLTNWQDTSTPRWALRFRLHISL